MKFPFLTSFTTASLLLTSPSELKLIAPVTPVNESEEIAFFIAGPSTDWAASIAFTNARYAS